MNEKVIFGLWVCGQIDTFACEWAYFGVIGGYYDSEYYLSFGEFDLLVVVGDDFGQILAKMKEFECGIGEGDGVHGLFHQLLPPIFCGDVEDLIVSLLVVVLGLLCMHVIQSQLQFQMSEHLQMSGESSLDKNFQIRTNNEGENELYIPCWEEEASNSTQYHHLIEQTKFFKNKCKHLENHLEENHREFSSLNQLYLIAETNQRRLLKENEDLKRQQRDLISELSQVKSERDVNSVELNASARRESQLRQKFKKKEAELLREMESLSAECEMLKRKSAVSGAEEQKWKRYYNQQVARNEQQWKAAYEQLEGQFDRKSKEVREKNEEVKSLNKNWNAHREDYEMRIAGLEADLEEARRQLAKLKTQVLDSQRQIKQLKLVRDDVSAKNDQIEAENSKLKRSLKDQSAKQQTILIERQKLQQTYDQFNNQWGSSLKEINTLKNASAQLRLKLGNLQKELNEARLEKDRILMSKNYAQNQIVNLQEEISTFRRQKQTEINSLKTFYQGKLRELKEASNNQRNNHQITFRQENDTLKGDKRQLTSRLQSTLTKNRQLQQQGISLRDEIETLRSKIERLSTKKREQHQPIQRQCNHQSEIADLKQEILSWRDKNDKLKTKNQEQLSLPRECHHQEEIFDLKKRLSEQQEEYRNRSTKLTREIEDLNTDIETFRVRVQEVEQENERLTREKRKLHEQNQSILLEKNRLVGQVQSLERERGELASERKQILSERRMRQDAEGEQSQKLRVLQQKLKEKILQLQKTALKVRSLEQELQNSRMRSKDETKDMDRLERERIKKYETKMKQKEREIGELQEKLQELQNEQEGERARYKAIQKQNRNKETELGKRQRKIKQLQDNIEQLQNQLHQGQISNQKDRSTIETLRKQFKSEQSTSHQLRIQIERQDSQKENWQNQQKNFSSSNRQYEKERRDWEEHCRRLTNQVKTKESQMEQLKRQIITLKQAQKTTTQPSSKIQSSHLIQQINNLQSKIHHLQSQVRQKEQTIKRMQSTKKKEEDIPSGSLQQLQTEYNRQLLALKRLIMYKGYKQDQNKRLQQLKTEYQGRIQVILADYRTMHQQMMILKEKVTNQRIILPPEPVVDVGALQDFWRVKLEQISEERQVLIEKVAMWQRKYEELRYLFEAKIESKEETINLLNLKLSNLEMARPICQYSCRHR